MISLHWLESIRALTELGNASEGEKKRRWGEREHNRRWVTDRQRENKREREREY